VLENILFYADLYGVPARERAPRLEQLLGFSNLTPFRHRLAGDLSGGMKQKLGLACALIHTPRVLFLDEPTNGVDPVSRRDFWRILYQLVREGVTSSSRPPTSTRPSAATASPSCTRAGCSVSARPTR
jgi:ABC-2 type transport system ATP-binding protein